VDKKKKNFFFFFNVFVGNAQKIIFFKNFYRLFQGRHV